MKQQTTAERVRQLVSARQVHRSALDEIDRELTEIREALAGALEVESSPATEAPPARTPRRTKAHAAKGRAASTTGATVAERRAAIVDLVARELAITGIAVCRVIRPQFEVSESTVYGDLMALAGEGLLEKPEGSYQWRLTKTAEQGRRKPAPAPPPAPRRRDEDLETVWDGSKGSASLTSGDGLGQSLAGASFRVNT